MSERVGTLAAFRDWTKHIVRPPETADAEPKRWISPAVAARRQVSEAPTQSALAIVKLLSAENLHLLHVIAERKPASVQDLADLTARTQASVSRTLKKLAAAGIVHLEPNEGRRLKPRLAATGVRLELDFRPEATSAVEIRRAESR